MPRDLAEVCAEIRYHHRQRVFAMDQRKRADLALGAFLRLQLGWRRDGDATANEKARGRAAELVAIGDKLQREAGRPAEKREAVAGADDADFAEWREVITAALMSRAPFAAIEAGALRAMRRLTRELPVHEWAMAIRGFGEPGLATIVAEAGDLSRYDGPAKLWKRFGLAVMGAVRQGGLGRGAGADAWIEHGYSARRRSLMWNVGQALFKGNADGEYRVLFLHRLAVEHAKAEAEGLIPATTTKVTVESWAARDLPPLARVTKLDPKLHRGAGHMNNRALRFVEKRLLRNLWRAWREASLDLAPETAVPPAESSAPPGRALLEWVNDLTAGPDVPEAPRLCCGRWSPDPVGSSASGLPATEGRS